MHHEQSNRYHTFALQCVVFAIVAFSCLLDGTFAQRKVLNPRRRAIRPTESVNTTMKTELNLHLDEVIRVCDLSDAQEMKLRTAAKGVIDLWNFEDHAKADDPRLGIAAGALAQANLAEPTDTNLGEFDDHRGALRRLVVSDPLWKDSLERVLTPKQQDKLRRERQQRRAYARQAAIRQIVAKIDQKVQLSPRQRDELETIVAEKLKGAVKVNWARQLVAIHAIIDAERMAQIIPNGELSSVLSEQQMTTWTARKAVQQPRGETIWHAR